MEGTQSSKVSTSKGITSATPQEKEKIEKDQEKKETTS